MRGSRDCQGDASYRKGGRAALRTNHPRRMRSRSLQSKRRPVWLQLRSVQIGLISSAFSHDLSGPRGLNVFGVRARFQIFHRKFVGRHSNVTFFFEYLSPLSRRCCPRPEPLQTMKSSQKPGSDRLFDKSPRVKGSGGHRDPVQERKEGLVLLAIAFLFLANVVLYLFHHYGLTS